MTVPSEEAIENDREIGFLDLAIVCAKYKRLVLGVPVAGAVLVALLTFLMPNVYTATARILPPQQDQSSTAALLGSLSGLIGTSQSSLGLKNPGELYVGMLRSATVADKLIERFDLRDLYGTDTHVGTRAALADVTSIASGKDGIISIAVDDIDPHRAASIANAYVEELHRLNDSLAITEAAQRRLFFENQVRETRNALAEAEVALKETQERTGLIKLEEQGKAIIEAIAALRAQVAAKEVELVAARSFATDRNPELIRKQHELAELRTQLKRMQQDPSKATGDVLMATNTVPKVGLEYLRRYRDVKYHEAILEVLAKQFELAKLDESRDASIVQIVDRATAPDRKSKPRRTIIVLLALFSLGVPMLLFAFLLEGLDRARQDPIQAARLSMLKSYLSLRKQG